jgi:hypothetical protein
MSNEAVRRIGELAGDTLVDTAWAQWSSLTSTVVRVGQEPAWTIVDPEALTLASFAVGHRERRLEDVVGSWAAGAAYLMSMQRMRTLASRFPRAVSGRIGDFARAAVAGGDKRWKRLVSPQAAGGYSPRLKPLEPLRLTDGPALTLRLRAGFGVNAKADLLSLLLGRSGVAADLKLIAAATAYTERAIRTATEEMVQAGFIHEIEGRPSSFFADAKAWAPVLEAHRPSWPEGTANAVPPWRFWAAGYAFLAGVVEWAESAQDEGWTPYVASSRARDLVEKQGRILRQAELDPRFLVLGRGTRYLAEFEELILRVREWAREGLSGWP